MTAALLRKEALEWRRTGRLWILLGVILFLAVLSAVTAWALPLLLASMDLGGGIVVEVPDATWRDGAIQWEKNLAQIGTVAVVLLVAGAPARELADGTVRHLVTMGVPRPAFVLLKTASAVVATAVSALMGSVLAWAVTTLLLPGAEFGAFLAPTALWLVLASFLMSVAVLGAVAFGSTVAGAGIALGAWAFAGVLGIWAPATDYGPAGIGVASAGIAAGSSVTWAWPVAVTVALTAVAVFAAVATFDRAEL